MARIAQGCLPLDWEAVEECPDLTRVRMAVENLPDEELMKALEARRWGRKDATPVRVKWNCLIIGRVLGHGTTNDLLREMRRNPALRRLAGINPALGARGVPDKDEMSRFRLKLAGQFAGEIERMQGLAVEELRRHLPGLGEELGTDTTVLRTWARGRRDPLESADPEADWGRKTRRWTDVEGKVHEELTKWFGYKGHLLVDTRYEVPLARRVTRASRPDAEKIMEMVREVKRRHPEMTPRTLSGDKAYDDGDLTRRMWEEEGIRAVFALRDTAQDGEDGEPLEGARNILLGDDGQVYCYAEWRGRTIRQAMRPWGFEASRGTLKYRCPAAVFGTECPERERCGTGRYGRVVRVKNHADWRRFGPLARNTKQWERLYARRTACERVNARLKVGMALDDLHSRGLEQITLSLDLAILALYGLAIGHLKRGAKKWRSYTRLAD